MATIVTEDGVRLLKEFVAEVLTVCRNDDGGDSYGDREGSFAFDLYDKTLQAGEVLGMTKEEMEEIFINA